MPMPMPVYADAAFPLVEVGNGDFGTGALSTTTSRPSNVCHFNSTRLHTTFSEEEAPLPLQQQLSVFQQEQMEMLHLDENDAKEWEYKGEGGANLILQYCGTSLNLIGKVLRLEKVLRKSLKDSQLRTDGPVLSIEEQLIWQDLKEAASTESKQMLAHAYAKLVIRPLLGFEFVDPGILVSVSKGFLEVVEQRTAKSRPKWRIKDGKIDHDARFALLMPDVSLLKCPNVEFPCIAIEIKPKCGFLTSSSFISEESYLKRSVSRFTMHQQLKVFQQKVSSISRYSPLDLFSESREQIQRALEGLFQTPQNNLRIFIDGSLVLGRLGGYADQDISDDDNVDSGYQCLEDVIEGIIFSQREERVACLKDLITETLLKSRVLRRLLELQKMDKYDIEGAIHAYYEVVQRPCQVCSQSGSTNHRQDSSSDLDPLQNERMTESPMEPRSRNLSQLHSSTLECLHSQPIDVCRRVVRDYLVAATAKDCSLILTFQPLPHGLAETSICDEDRVIHLSSIRQSFSYKATLIDIDLKPLEKMVQYYRLDREIVEHYTSIHSLMNRNKTAVCSEDAFQLS